MIKIIIAYFALTTVLIAGNDDDLWTAIVYNDIPSAVKAIKSGANVNTPKSKMRATPLMYTVAMNHRRLTMLLLSHKANVNTKDKAGITALYIARKLHNQEMADLLISEGAKK